MNELRIFYRIIKSHKKFITALNEDWHFGMSNEISGRRKIFALREKKLNKLNFFSALKKFSMKIIHFGNFYAREFISSSTKINSHLHVSKNFFPLTHTHMEM